MTAAASALPPVSPTAAAPAPVAIVIPALNESGTIRAVAQAALQQCPHLIVVDDGSSDDTADKLAGLPLTLIRHARCLGKGEALRSGFKAALALGVAGVVTMDGDGQHGADDIPLLLTAAAAHPGQIIIGARLIGRDDQPRGRRRANNVADWFISWACGQRILDSQSGQRYYPREAMALAGPARQGFVFETGLLIRAADRGIGTVAVPIRARYHQGLRGSHFRPLLDGTRITLHITASLLSRGLAPWRAWRAWRRPAVIHEAGGAPP